MMKILKRGKLLVFCALLCLLFARDGISVIPGVASRQVKTQTPVIDRFTGEGNLARENSTPVNPRVG